MSEFAKLALLAGVGAGIGWITNFIAIKLMFRPLKPVSIGGLKFQGLIPKRKEEIAKSVGKVVEEELLSFEDLIETFMEEDNLSPIKTSMKFKIRSVVEEKLPGILPGGIKSMIVSYIDKMVDEDGDRVIKEFVSDMASDESRSIRLSNIIESKINSFEMDRIEKIVVEVANKELKHIEIVGAFLGFAIGLVQGAIVILV